MEFLYFPEWDLKDLEVVGMDGGIGGAVACSRSLPVIRHRITSVYALYSERTPGYAESEIHEFAESVGLTLFPAPVPLIEDAIAVYVTVEMLVELGLDQPPSEYAGKPLQWQKIEQFSAFATVMDQKASKDLLNGWSVVLTRRALALIQRFFLEGDARLMTDAYRLLEFAHNSAHAPELQLFIDVAQAVATRWIPGMAYREMNIISLVPSVFKDISEDEFGLMVDRLELISRQHPDRRFYPEVILWADFSAGVEDAYSDEIDVHHDIHGFWVEEEMTRRGWTWIIISGLHVITGSNDPVGDMPFADDADRQAAASGLLLFVCQRP